MAEKEIKRHLEELRRRAASNDISGFAAKLHGLLTENFEKWFPIVREQKVLGKFRDLASIQELRRVFEGFHSTLSKQNVAMFAHHLRVCEFMQSVFTQIDKEALVLECCAAHPENIARAVVRFVEIAHHAFQLNARTNPDSVPLTTTMSQLAELEGRFRSILDAGNTVINSTAAKNGFDRDHVVSDSELNDLFRLAHLYGEMLQVLDLYTYRGAEIRIRRRSLVVKQSEREADVAAVVGSERSGDHDHVRHSILAPLEVNVHRECHSVPSGTSDTFFDFLRKIGGTNALVAARHFVEAFKNDLRIEVSEVISLEATVTTKAGRFTVDELIRAWAVLHMVALLGQRWNERLAGHRSSRGRQTTEASPAPTVLEVPVPELDKNWLVWGR